MEEIFKNTVKKGIIYSPAWKNYGSKTIIIVCDVCKNEGQEYYFDRSLKTCISHDGYDICLNCAKIICKKSLTDDPDFSLTLERILSFEQNQKK